MFHIIVITVFHTKITDMFILVLFMYATDWDLPWHSIPVNWIDEPPGVFILTPIHLWMKILWDMTKHNN